MRATVEAVFDKYLDPVPDRPGFYTQSGKTMVLVESRQWKLAYSPLERVTFDLNDEYAIVLDVPTDHGVHIIPWHMVLRITVSHS
jgi:hypothetical protein